MVMDTSDLGKSLERVALLFRNVKSVSESFPEKEGPSPHRVNSWYGLDTRLVSVQSVLGAGRGSIFFSSGKQAGDGGRGVDGGRSSQRGSSRVSSVSRSLGGSKKALKDTPTPHKGIPMASSSPKLGIVFDADGTLIDSLPPHVSFVRAMNEEKGFGLILPEPADLEGCRRVASAPMIAFFQKAGFPDEALDRLVEEYRMTFATRFPVKPFAGVEDLLRWLGTFPDVNLCIVSSNTVANVEDGLGEKLCKAFDFIIGVDTEGARDKAAGIAIAVERLGLPPASVIYVGDTMKDCLCAGELSPFSPLFSKRANSPTPLYSLHSTIERNGVEFRGVSYGFEPLGNEGCLERRKDDVAATVDEMRTKLQAWIESQRGHTKA